ncbi:TIR domain-containing protein [Desulfonema limicola]|uniref:TIR domain-containing protein n=1 Tax=Desulfonema limicola TaxID=45656 RepID=A0A975GFP4_9BACT|nr:TIR domain-containing protein [Desulfonema limicola]QTA79453.1 TIR domain-containing protein [Desulfonema limicola]
MTIFISYAPDDRAIAEKLHADLKNKGLNPWMADIDLLPGQKKEETIRRTIKQSSFFLAVLSSKSFSSRGAVHKEIRQALDMFDEFPDSDIFVIPVRIDDCTNTHEKLENLFPVDLFPDYSAGFERLMPALSKSRNNSYPKSEEKKVQPETGQLKENQEVKQEAYPAWVLKVSVGSALAFLVILLILAVFIPDPSVFQIFVFRVILALAAAGFGATIPGFLKVEMPLWKKGLISATGAIALFVVVYMVNPPELISHQEPQKKEQKIKQPLSGFILDENGSPVSGVSVSLLDFGLTRNTDNKGAFYFEVEADKQAVVRIMAQKQGFKTWRQDASLGNAGLSFKMEKEKIQ